jgi:hypothetical protein
MFFCRRECRCWCLVLLVLNGLGSVMVLFKLQQLRTVKCDVQIIVIREWARIWKVTVVID